MQGSLQSFWLGFPIATALVLGPTALAGGPGPPGPDGPDARLAASATAFAEQFLAGDYDAIAGKMTDPMRAAFPAGLAESVRNEFVAQWGAVEHVGAAWNEGEIQGHLRFRVPVEFEKGLQDLRVVFDADGKVAGFFHVAHEPPPSERAGGKAPSEPAEPRPDVEGHWEGTIEVPGSPLSVVIDLAQGGDGWSGTFGSPAQGVSGIPLEAVRVSGAEIEFAIADVPGAPVFKGKLTAGEISGTFTQSGQSFPFRLGRETSASPARPQESLGSLPYDEEPVTYASGDVTLAGTLTMPRGPGPFPAALLVSGSGPQDRNEEVFSHKPFLVLADALTRAGIAILRVDDRGVGDSTGSLAGVTTADLARDALEGVRVLANNPRIASGKVGLIGHSEGAMIAPLAASESDGVAFVVMLAGPGVPGAEILSRQLELISRAAGLGEERIAAIVAEQRKLLELLATGADRDRIRSQVRRLIVAQRGGTEGDEVPSDTTVEELVAAQMQQVMTPWLVYFLKYDPQATLRKIKVPVLALCGERDLQVDPKQNLPPIREALEAAGNPDVTVRELPGLNHLFQTATSGSPQEYYSIEETISPLALATIRDWILARFGAG
jgi:pimeloyl-ACP methyl ester carboxylesterase